MIPGLSTTGQFTTIVPLMIFISISMAKEGYDDLRRNKLDKVENNNQTFVLRDSEPSQNVPVEERRASMPMSELNRWTKKKWEDVRVGDIIKLEK
jgi:phospholipid-translocating ATPase